MLDKNKRHIENFHILLWLLKDNAWCHDWHFIGIAMLVPTFLIQVYLTWSSRKDADEIFHSIAVLLWIMANGVWMTGEFFFKDTWRLLPEIFFGVGLATIVAYYIKLLVFRKRED